MNDASDAAEQSSLQALVHGVFVAPDGGAQLLSAFDRQRRALTSGARSARARRGASAGKHRAHRRARV